MMLKLFDRNKRKKDHWLQLIVASDLNLCCYILIDAEEPTERNTGYVGIGRLTQAPVKDYCLTWRGRLYTAWQALRGTLWGYDIDFFTKEDCDRFMDAMKSARDHAFPLES